MARILVRGANEFGSAIAHRCLAAGHAVVLHDTALPDACHRSMAFTDAIFDGEAELEGVRATRIDNLDALESHLHSRAAIPVVTADLAAVLTALRPDALIDARMRKRARPEAQRGLAPLTIGLGPNFVAGETADLIIETGFGEDFGRVSAQGATRPLAGEPPPVLGHGRERFLYAPVDGLLRTHLRIGDPVTAGDPIATIDATALTAPLTGALRGLTHDNVPVLAGARVAEIDPRGPEAVTPGIGPRQRRLAEIVMAILRERLEDALATEKGE